MTMRNAMTTNAATMAIHTTLMLGSPVMERRKITPGGREAKLTERLPAEVAPGIKTVSAIVADIRLDAQKRQRQPLQRAGIVGQDITRTATAAATRAGYQREEIPDHGEHQRSHREKLAWLLSGRNR